MSEMQDLEVSNRVVVRDLSLFYNGRVALKDINVCFPSNSVTALIGPSGSGKSTFLRCINRMHDNDHQVRVQGSVEIDGYNIYDAKLNIFLLRAKVGMVFQKPNPFMKSIYENVAYGPKIHGTACGAELDELVVKSLKRAGLYGEVECRLHESAYNLSGGQQQRLCIARALAVCPEVILMDEPCSALDPVSSATIDDLILELKKNYTILIVTHSMRQALKVADYVAFFDHGSILEYGPAESVLHDSANSKVKEYIRSGLK